VAVRKRKSGPSGRNKQPQRIVRASPELWALVDEAVVGSGVTWSEWARQAFEAKALASR
jgi:hypothetical protein